MTPGATFRLRTEDVSWRALDDKIVVLDLSSSKYLLVEGSGGAIWQDLVAGANEAQLVERLRESFDVDVATAQVDVRTFVRELGEFGLLATTES